MGEIINQRQELHATPLPQTKQQVVEILKQQPIEFWENLNPRTVEDCFNPELPSISCITSEIGSVKMIALMVKWINSFVNFYSSNGTMDAYQIGDTISLIREEYPHYTPMDFKLFFKMAKKGYFGQIYGRMDGEVIMQWLRKYDMHRDTAAQETSINEAKLLETAKKADDGCISYDEYLALQEEKARKGDLQAAEALLNAESNKYMFSKKISPQNERKQIFNGNVYEK